jgi:CDP-6-deoxy-D-xylo-4-hexulose-3-dehydrase
MRIPLAHSRLRKTDINAAISVLKSEQLTMGKQVAAFEAKMAKYLGTEYFVMVNSGSSANLLMIEALLRPSKGKPRLMQGDGVLVPAIAWPTTIWPLIQLGLNPIFVDIDSSTLAIDFNQAQQTIDESKIKIKAIFPIHPLGYAISPSQLSKFTERNGLVLISDVCESLGSWSEGRHAGNVGIASSYSFYFSHHITTMEGGGIATNDLSVCDDLKSMRSHGWSRDRSDVSEWNKDLSLNDSKFLFVSTGYNVRPTELQAALGLSQIKDIDKFISKRRYIVKRVIEALEGSELSVIGAETFKTSDSQAAHSWMLIPIIVKGQDSVSQKKRIVEILNNKEIETRPVLTGNFLTQPAIRRITKNLLVPETFKTASRIAETAFLVGAHHDMREDQINFLCDTLATLSR